MAAQPVIDYFHLIHEKSAVHLDCHFGIYDPPAVPYLTEDVTRTCIAFFDKALALADDDEVYKRVKTASMSIRYWEAWSMPLDKPERAGLVDKFFRDLTELDIVETYESWGTIMREARERMNKGLAFRILTTE
jgi:hypothetical protein